VAKIQFIHYLIFPAIIIVYSFIVLIVQLPQQLVESLKNAKGFDKETFEEVHASGEQITSIRLNPLKPVAQFPNFKIFQFQNSSVPWTDHGYYLETRPSFTFDPLFHAGCYYVQEASSMFLEQALKQTTDLSQPLKVLDLCAAPGGKSTHIQSLLSKDSLLVSNEVIKSRVNILKDNIIKWGHSNAIISHNDPKDFVKLTGFFDVIVIDAPCSGSGLFRRDPAAMDEWSPNNVQLCSQRQQRILADVWPALKENGILVYSTCSYSVEEDEDIIKWLLAGLQIENCRLQIDHNWGIVESGGGYRFWPDKIKGEGFFLACFRKKENHEGKENKLKNKPEFLGKKEREVVEKWVKTEGVDFIRHENTVYAWLEEQKNNFSFLLNQLRIIYSGTIIGELMRDKLVPDHALAMSKLVPDTIGRTDLDYKNAIQYLQKKDITIDMTPRGWQLVAYEGQPLGWANVLSNRVNNYYPKELRILKDH
jgi:16S rRNA C967 or C1407 C5-methylase (RsmB/RsmF family)/NOL1/NOP2/fmu family ribosome biogenesis protein